MSPYWPKSTHEPGRIFYFRHGQTDWNAQRRFQGHTDIPLNETGITEARLLAPKIRDLHLDIIVSSDLGRAMNTAQICAELTQVPIVISKELREAGLGVCEGLLLEEIIKTHGDHAWSRWTSISKDDADFCYPEGETKGQQLARVRVFLEDFAAKNPGLKRIGVSTHGGVLRQLVHHAEGAPREKVPMHNCVLFRLHFSPLTMKWEFGSQL